MRQNVRARPIEYVQSGEWPNAELEPSVPAEYAQTFARNLAIATQGLSLREVGRAADLDPMTIRALLRGDRYPDTVSVSKLELAYRQLLWPSDKARRRILTEVSGDSAEAIREREEFQRQEAMDILTAALDGLRYRDVSDEVSE